MNDALHTTIERYSTRANPMIDPSLHVWGWEIPAYLFLGGWVAGMLVLLGIALRKGEPPRRESILNAFPWLGLLLLSLGMLALFLDLEYRRHVVRLYLTFEPASPMSWGAWILLLVYPVLAATTRMRAFGARALVMLGNTAIVAGIGLGIYTGILLGAFGARPLWNSALLGPLFLLSGLSTAAAFGHLVSGDHDERARLAELDVRFLGAELLALVLLLIGLATSSSAGREAAGLVLGGAYTAVFWVLIVGLGIVVPGAVQFLAVRGRIRHAPVAPILVLAGALALRTLFVVAGQASAWPPY